MLDSIVGPIVEAIENHRSQWLPGPEIIEKPMILMVGPYYSIKW